MLLGLWPSSTGPQEIQLKGAGPTPYSRRGDGRAVLRSSIREFLCSEAMAALGVATTRALCIIGSPEPVQRESWETAAVVTRVAPSFLRFGHFEHFAHTNPQPQALRHLADETIRIGYPQCLQAPHHYLSLLEEIALRTADCIAHWQSLGFCHGVMNTDNLSVLGLTLDYGPFGFLDTYDPGHICNHSDHQGRYAFHAQPQIAFWNLFALASAMLPLLPSQDSAKQAVAVYETAYPRAYLAHMRRKLGLRTEQPVDAALIQGLLNLMRESALDYTSTWRALADFSAQNPQNSALRQQFKASSSFDSWATSYAQRLCSEASQDTDRRIQMNQVNPKYILRNHLAQAAITAAEQGDFAPVQTLLNILSQPFKPQAEHQDYALPPPSDAPPTPISCSS
jgi:serine/tyrosine/threonine adenylyltransferase